MQMVMMPFPWLLSLAILLGLPACVSQDQRQPTLRLAKNDTTAVSFDHARQLLDHGENAQAISAFRTLLRQDGASVPVLNGLAIAHAELDRPDLAASLFAEALAISPDDPTTLNNIGFAALRRKDTELALSYLKKAQQHGDHTPEISGNLALLKRLEARSDSVVAEPALLSARIVGRASKLQRETVSTVRLSRIKTEPTAPATARVPASPTSSATLIDFNDLYDPWSAIPMDESSL